MSGTADRSEVTDLLHALGLSDAAGECADGERRRVRPVSVCAVPLHVGRVQVKTTVPVTNHLDNRHRRQASAQASYRHATRGLRLHIGVDLYREYGPTYIHHAMISDRDARGTQDTR